MTLEQVVVYNAHDVRQQNIRLLLVLECHVTRLVNEVSSITSGLVGRPNRVTQTPQLLHRVLIELQQFLLGNSAEEHYVIG